MIIQVYLLYLLGVEIWCAEIFKGYLLWGVKWTFRPRGNLKEFLEKHFDEPNGDEEAVFDWTNVSL